MKRRRRQCAWMLLCATAMLSVGCQVIRLPFGLIVNHAPAGGTALDEAALQQRIKLPRGFFISIYATELPNARMMRFTASGDLLVSSPREGKVFLVERGSNAAYSDKTRTLLNGLHNPHGLALHEDWLYVAEETAIFRVRFSAATRQVSGEREYVVRSLPADGRHWTRTIGIGPDGWLYVSVGSSCNVCIEEDVRRAAISRYQPDGSNEQLYATGLRNAVGFAWRSNGDLYATDNGRDLLGDDFPPCELNHIVESGFYGWPYASGNRIPDPSFGAGNEARVAASIAPVHGFTAHTAPLGITFYDADGFPQHYRGAAFVAQHGSWNRSKKSGYKIVALLFDSSDRITEEDFASGFEIDDDVAGRPVDVAVGPDGALYLSDDFAGSVYRIAYGTAPPHSNRLRTPVAEPVPHESLDELSESQRSEAAARGEAIWQTNGCAGCHVSGSDPNQAAVHPLSALGRKYSLESLQRFLKTPQPPMPIFPFSDSQRRDLAMYLLQQHP
ncbi:MAG TPA: PQQ-dependent sugar dehydrogenase [Candidatus Acidoferrales bacterium]|nr:PQQ-dependent sugar dehydrogenase [Candidatus Acidoferrales bacterium]